MGADIHWIAERLHRDGTWEASFSKASCRGAAGPNYWLNSAYLSGPAEPFNQRDYTWFGILSGVRCDPISSIGEIANSQLPVDASSHTRLEFDDDDLHSTGWFTQTTLVEALLRIQRLPNASTEYEEEIEVLQHRIALIDRMIRNDEAFSIKTDEILFGRAHDVGQYAAFPDMATESNHAKLLRQERINGLLPLSQKTLRFCIAYDN